MGEASLSFGMQPAARRKAKKDAKKIYLKTDLQNPSNLFMALSSIRIITRIMSTSIFYYKEVSPLMQVQIAVFDKNIFSADIGECFHLIDRN
ncbi:MAG: hypothetical protein ACOX7I_06635 [Oscillospiraceae bacterium]